MVRILGRDLPRKKTIFIGLTYIFGIGFSTSRNVLVKAKVNPNTRIFDLKDEDLTKLRVILENQYQTEGDLKRSRAFNIARHVDIGSSAGRRHRSGLPVHGQRTKTNARTCKKARKIVVVKSPRK